jgi:hypothetical protein
MSFNAHAPFTKWNVQENKSTNPRFVLRVRQTLFAKWVMLPIANAAW